VRKQLRTVWNLQWLLHDKMQIRERLLRGHMGGQVGSFPPTQTPDFASSVYEVDFSASASTMAVLAPLPGVANELFATLQLRNPFPTTNPLPHQVPLRAHSDARDPGGLSPCCAVHRPYGGEIYRYSHSLWQ